MSTKRAASPTGPTVSPPPTKRKLQSTTTSKAVSSFFKPASQKTPEQIRWRTVEKSLIVAKYTVDEDSRQQQHGPLKIAAFDLDDTIIKPLAGSKWVKSATSWQWWNARVPAKLKELRNEGYLVVILSNQSTITLKENPKTVQKDPKSLSNFKDQATAVLRQLDIPISVYAATEHDNYRKPRVGMWKELLEDYDLDFGKDVDLSGSFYVGDAAGREKTDNRPKDHACSDRDLAANIGISFYTPEEYFLGQKPEPFTRLFEPSIYLDCAVKPPPGEPFKKLNALELIIFCGSPGAGKSTFFWKLLKPLGFERVNQDILKTRDKCVKVALELLRSGRSVAVDNTNADPDTRTVWVNVAKCEQVPIRCVYFTASSRLCEHNDTVRALNPRLMNPENRKILPGVAFRSFASRFRKPDLSEGFQDITTIDFMFRGTPEQQLIWSQYWVSKYSTS